jgi:APA family basic amino acid/polyamine antiporter
MDAEFKRVLTLFDATALVAGTVIGSGIFLTTGLLAQQVSSPLWILVVWLAGGITSFLGALVLAQLGMLYPQAGGMYVYLREAFGGGIAFLYGFTVFTVFKCGSIAAVSVGFAHYFGRFVEGLGMERTWVTLAWGRWSWNLQAGQVVAIVLIWLLTYFNYRGARLGSLIQNVFTCLKIGALLAFVTAGILLLGRSAPSAPTVSHAAPSLSQFGLALIGVMWAFTGWDSLTYAAEEIERTHRNIPLALLGAMGVVTLVYLLVNFVYVAAVPISAIQGKERVAEIVAQNLFGFTGGNLIALAVLVSTLGTINGVIFLGPRVYFAMARDGVFAGIPARLHPAYQTPHVFLLLQGLWASVLVLVGNYETLFTFVMFPGFLFFSLTCLALLILRARRPQVKLVWGWSYPVIPIVFLLCYLALAVNTLYTRPWISLAGMGIFVLALPLYLGMKRKGHRQ